MALELSKRREIIEARDVTIAHLKERLRKIKRNIRSEHLLTTHLLLCFVHLYSSGNNINDSSNPVEMHIDKNIISSLSI